MVQIVVRGKDDGVVHLHLAVIQPLLQLEKMEFQ